MVIGSAMFYHEDIDKMTCKSHDGNTFNQTDNLLIDVTHLSYLMDIGAYRGRILILITT
jgi:hypothetical protein